MTLRGGYWASYLRLTLDRLQMAVVVADAEQRVAGASEEEINIILHGRDIKNTNWTVVWRSAKKKPCVCVTKICTVLRNFWWQYWLCGLKKKEGLYAKK